MYHVVARNDWQFWGNNQGELEDFDIDERNLSVKNAGRWWATCTTHACISLSIKMLQLLYINLGIGKTMLSILNQSDYKTKRGYVQSGEHHETTDTHTQWMLHMKQAGESIFGKYLVIIKIIVIKNIHINICIYVFVLNTSV